MGMEAQGKNPAKPEEPHGPAALEGAGPLNDQPRPSGKVQAGRATDNQNYVLREVEGAAIQKQRERMAARFAPTVKVERNGTQEQIRVAHPIERAGFDPLMEALGTGDHSRA